MFREDVERGPDGSSQIFVQPLLGCYSRAPGLKEAVKKVSSKVLEYGDWLQSHGETIRLEPIRLKLCETITGDWPVDLGDSVALFECDKEGLGSEEIDQYLRWMDYSWDDFQRLVRKVPKAVLDWKPSSDTRRSIRTIIIHIALVQVWYLMKLRKRGEPAFRYPRGLPAWSYVDRIDRQGDISPETLNTLRKAVVFRLRNLRDAELGRITYHKPGGWTGRTVPEAWTARKVFRRFLWHEKLHMSTMRKLLAAYQKRLGA